MSQVYGIGDTAKKLYAKLADRLAGPLQEFLPAFLYGLIWICRFLSIVTDRVAVLPSISTLTV